jgi:ATP adenylyltransferase
VQPVWKYQVDSCSRFPAYLAHLALADRPFSLKSLPYANHVSRLPQGLAYITPEERGEKLAGIFLSLYDLAIATVRHDADYPSGPPSFNVILTLEHIHVIPRKHENFVLPRSGEPFSVNSLGFAGYSLVKSEEELGAVKTEVGQLVRSLRIRLLTTCFREWQTSCVELVSKACMICKSKVQLAK